MTEQLDLGDSMNESMNHPAAAHALKARQQQVWDYVRSHDGVSADEAGAHLHAQRGRHPEHQRCEWCATDGRSVLTSVGLRPLVTYRRVPGQGRLYVARDKADRPAAPAAEAVSHHIHDDPFAGL